MLRKKGGTGSDEKLVNNAVNNILKKGETYILHIQVLITVKVKLLKQLNNTTAKMIPALK